MRARSDTQITGQATKLPDMGYFWVSIVKVIKKKIKK